MKNELGWISTSFFGLQKYASLQLLRILWACVRLSFYPSQLYRSDSMTHISSSSFLKALYLVVLTNDTGTEDIVHAGIDHLPSSGLSIWHPWSLTVEVRAPCGERTRTGIGSKRTYFTLCAWRHFPAHSLFLYCAAHLSRNAGLPATPNIHKPLWMPWHLYEFQADCIDNRSRPSFKANCLCSQRIENPTTPTTRIAPFSHTRIGFLSLSLSHSLTHILTLIALFFFGSGRGEEKGGPSLLLLSPPT